MDKITPVLNITGKYTVKEPFKIKAGMDYTCIAIRNFEDMYKAGFDVYTDFYVPNGITIDNGFNFEEEKSKEPNIISLMSKDGSVLYIPDTFITSIPAGGDIFYQHVIMACSLGMLPSELDLSVLLSDVADFIGARIGHVVDTKLIVSPSLTQPTFAEHQTLETARKAAVTVQDNLTTKNIALTKQNEILTNKLNVTLEVLKKNNLLK